MGAYINGKSTTDIELEKIRTDANKRDNRNMWLIIIGLILTIILILLTIFL